MNPTQIYVVILFINFTNTKFATPIKIYRIKVMVISANETIKSKIIINNKPIEQVGIFTFL